MYFLVKIQNSDINPQFLRGDVVVGRFLSNNLVELLQRGNNNVITTILVAVPHGEAELRTCHNTIFGIGRVESAERDFLLALTNNRDFIMNTSTRTEVITSRESMYPFDDIGGIRVWVSNTTVDNPFLKNEKPVSVKPDQLVNPELKLYIDHNNISFDGIKQQLKYIPVRVSGVNGWYSEKFNKIVVLKYPIVKTNDRGSNTKYITKFLDVETKDLPGLINANSLKFCKFKVKNYVESSKIFKFTNEKKEALNKEFEAVEIVFGYIGKNNKEPINTVSLRLPNGIRRFILSDVEITYPNINGYIEPKDRSFKDNSKVKVVDDRKLDFKKDDVLTVKSVKNIGLSKKFISFKEDKNNKYYNSKKFKVI